MLLETIKKENDIKKIPKDKLDTLASELRERVIEVVSANGGHLASNLGVVELTIALHYCLNFPEDKLIWDVGHQSYIHKILTGRNEQMETLRKYKGLSGFPKRCESDADCFETGHSSTSISAGLGFVCAREIKKEDYTVVSVIGDGSLTGGLAYEALNNLSEIKSNYIIILNDNEFSISANIGGVSKMLNSIRTADPYLNLKDRVENRLLKTEAGKKVANALKKAKFRIKELLIPNVMFENLGITYLGPVDGHDISSLIKVINQAKKIDHAVVVHIKTKKGKGYEPAEVLPPQFHGIGAFDRETGEILSTGGKTYSKIFSETILELAKTDERIVAVSAAMAEGTGLSKFREEIPERFFDVGIAEQHAITFCAGLCAAGLKPVAAIFSSFLQRAFDEVIHDVCMQNLPVVIAIDRAGLVGADGQTHHGVFDLSYLSLMPNITIMAPKNGNELKEMVKFAVDFDKGPIAVRYPRGEAWQGLADKQAPIEYGKWEMLFEESDTVIVACGVVVEAANEVRDKLVNIGRSCSLVNARFIKPIDEDMLIKLAEKHKKLITIEDNTVVGGLGSMIVEAVNRLKLDLDVRIFAVPDSFVEHGKVSELKKELCLDAESIFEEIR